MSYRSHLYFIVFFLVTVYILPAQRVAYSSVLTDRALLGFSVAGKVGDFYWLQKEQRKRGVSHRAEDWMKQEQSFAVFNSRLERINNIAAAPLTANTLKKYMVCGVNSFDEITLEGTGNKTMMLLQRYSPEGLTTTDSVIAVLPFNEPGHRFIMVTSQDKSKTLLLGFESVPESAAKCHAIVFDENWKQLSNRVYDHPYITQPFIQDDFFCFPSVLNNSPVQLANNGEWLMASPSRSNHNFLLFHFDGHNTLVQYKEIKLPPTYALDDVALSISNETGEAFAGIMGRYRQTVYKNVHVTHYSFAQRSFDFDTSYRFYTVAGVQAKENNLVKEGFVAVPGKGFVLLKEYGRMFSSNTSGNYEPWFPLYLLNNSTGPGIPAKFPLAPNNYSRYKNSSAISDHYNRGDLSIFYFPAQRSDSCWSGFINKTQVTELNAPTLSYLFLPLPDKLVLLYNDNNSDRYAFGNSTVLDAQGRLVADRELISWQADQGLLFQQALQITSNEVAVPFKRNGESGFAVIKF